jgi:hypothetical protein
MARRADNKYSKRVTVAVTPKEYRALQWVAQREQMQRYPGSASPKRPGRGAVLRTMSVAQALERYEQDEALRRQQPHAPTTEAAGQ